ncbi:hypothetical protein ABT124_15825 [Streptomyces sp. NPDC001982]|uniref:hypothetical protein n=1 Tax=Streptomyces sp. NPDC001982 TaxID=3154405 RepID=UPI00331F11FB
MSDLANTFSPFGMPKAVSEAEAERDKAYDARGDAELKYADVADDHWQARAHQRDAEAAKAATLAGKPLPTGPTHYERAAALRGEAMGVLEALRGKALQADHAVAIAWQQAAPDMADDIRAAYVAAERARAEAERAVRNATGVMRSAAIALVGTRYAQSAGPLPRLDGDPTWNTTFSEFCRQFVASHGLSIDTDGPEYRAVEVDGLARLLPTDAAEKLISAGVAQRA